MKYLFLLLLSSFILLSCSKTVENNFSSYGTQAFAYSLDSGWEVNGLTRVKGFKQTEDNGKFLASFSYTVDLITPQKDTVKSIASKIIDKTNSEKMTDTEIDTQFDLDSTYQNGDYKIIFNVKDQNTGQKASSSASFKLD